MSSHASRVPSSEIRDALTPKVRPNAVSALAFDAKEFLDWRRVETLKGLFEEDSILPGQVTADTDLSWTLGPRHVLGKD